MHTVGISGWYGMVHSDWIKAQHCVEGVWCDACVSSTLCPYIDTLANFRVKCLSRKQLKAMRSSSNPTATSEPDFLTHYHSSLFSFPRGSLPYISYSLIPFPRNGPSPAALLICPPTQPKLRPLISPHCDTFGAAACGLLIKSTADSGHAPLSPTMPLHTHSPPWGSQLDLTQQHTDPGEEEQWH